MHSKLLKLFGGLGRQNCRNDQPLALLLRVRPSSLQSETAGYPSANLAVQMDNVMSASVILSWEYWR